MRYFIILIDSHGLMLEMQNSVFYYRESKKKYLAVPTMPFEKVDFIKNLLAWKKLTDVNCSFHFRVK